MSAVLALEGVGKRYWRGEHAHWLLRRATLRVAAGEVVSVVAMRSQGKTTLLRIAAGMTAPEEGRVLLADRELRHLSDRAHARLLREQIGMAGRQGPGIGVQMLDYVAMRLALGGRRRRREVRSEALRALELVGAEQCAERHWEELSDWERALVEIAQAIAGMPQLLLIDDVLDGLGMRETDALGQLVRALAAERRLGVLMAVSDPEAALCSHRVLSLSDGRLAALSPLPPAESLAEVVPAPRGGVREPPENVIEFPSRVSRPGLRDAR
ncbi:MAG TPA: ATP-binding cassette domain-containing protein [Solirubrobacteraceae bacterium]|jgi:putative ABC transport system ATP-binding protein|nr:ATP-binding cassette domain-containing protein [Solirubrobacteraceae bacterium]